jgi:hypothetical protein
MIPTLHPVRARNTPWYTEALTQRQQLILYDLIASKQYIVAGHVQNQKFSGVSSLPIFKVPIHLNLILDRELCLLFQSRVKRD